MIRIVAVFAVIQMFLSVVSLNALSQDGAKSETKEEIAIRESATSPAGFAPKGWMVIKVVKGDLDGDGVADAAIVLEKGKGEMLGEVDSETFSPVDGDRILLIAFRNKDGKLHRSAVSQEALIGHHEGGVRFLEPLDGIYIKNKILIVDQFIGSSWFSSLTKRYRYENGRWVTIGMTDGYYCGLAANPQLDHSDYNVVTGFVIETMNAGYAEYLDSQKGDEYTPMPDEVLENENEIKRSFYKLRAGEVKKAPIIDGNVTTDEWPGLSVNLSNRNSVVGGRAAWRGPSDLSARLGAAIHNENLYLRAEVTDDEVTDGDQLQLVSKAGQIVKPTESKKRTDEHGYVVESRYPLKELESSRAQNSKLLRLSVEIVDVDNSTKRVKKVISTSCGGRKYAAGILPTSHIGLPPIETQE